MANDLVSVLVPTYNRAYCLPRAVDSALAQTHQNLEVLIIDDGSTDDTPDLVERLYGGDSRVRYVRQPNQGVSAARNTGIAAARGEFVGLLDSDDYWYPWKIAAQLAVLMHLPEVGMVWTNLEAVDVAGRVIAGRSIKTMYATWRQFRDDEIFSRHFAFQDFAPQFDEFAKDAVVSVGEIFTPMIVGSLVHTSTTVIRRERLEKTGLFPIDMRAGEDYDFHLRTCREGTVAFLDLPSIQYQCGLDDHLSGDRNKIHVALNYLKTVAPYLERDRHLIHLSNRQLRRVIADAHRWVGDHALNLGEPNLAREHFRQSLCLNWRQPRYAALYLSMCLPFQFGDHLRNTLRQCKRLLRARTVPTA